MTALTCATLLSNHPQAWQSATVHPFLQNCQQGTITPDQFNTWLVQDYLFVTEFTRLAAQLLAAAPVSHFDTLLSGMAALKDELLWFQAKATERSLSLSAALQPTCQAYCEFMQSQATQPYAVQATTFWAIELAYNQGWQTHSPMPEPYTEFADRWGNPGFTDYVRLLEQQANAALATADTTEQKQAEQSFLKVAQLEKDFWQMAFLAE
ncbi:TenA family transcriptional regulator [cf. Phormidesmis sp. LEGE 11477]|uniref:TenA family transcriptional regulator n=1 Tax=cf. Phormidesmis sp. LEGE 11477 TaxID=1828680 RepID=UPI001881BC7D|nr:TenA family transcriptional regulator [cf. Phormidesmis sp. LEGE 11477]MBE9063645.1 TenA family transcriptional regulator [cf. Phormidesmis sp. LEGE 11477]